MALFGLNIFDQLTQGRWDETSSCGLNKECKAAKACIAQVCTPARALYGESVYDPCVTACQREPRPKQLADLLCTDPKNAWDVWGFSCEGYTPAEQPGLKLAGMNISWFIVGALIALAIIVYLLFFMK